MFNNFLMKRLLKSKMKNLPEANQDKMLKVISENPDLFKNIAMEIQEEMKKGKDQMAATMEVMQKHQLELKNIIG